MAITRKAILDTQTQSYDSRGEGLDEHSTVSIMLFHASCGCANLKFDSNRWPVRRSKDNNDFLWFESCGLPWRRHPLATKAEHICQQRTQVWPV